MTFQIPTKTVLVIDQEKTSCLVKSLISSKNLTQKAVAKQAKTCPVRLCRLLSLKPVQREAAWDVKLFSAVVKAINKLESKG